MILAGITVMLMQVGQLCTGTAAPVVEVSTHYMVPATDDGHSVYQMTSAFDRAQRMGDYNGSIAISYAAPVKVSGSEGQGFCLTHESIEISITLSAALRVASDFDLDSCRYNSIARHEHEHHAADKFVIEKFAPRLEDGLRLAFSGPIEPHLSIPAAMIQDQASLMGAAVISVAQDLLAGMYDERAARQAAIDTPENYRFLAADCRNDGFDLNPERSL